MEGKYHTIAVTKKIKKKLDALKEYKRQSYMEIIDNLIKEGKK